MPTAAPVDEADTGLASDAESCEEETDELVDQAGVILGLHNVAVSSPQVIATLLSSAIFHALQKERGTPGDDSVGWVLRFCGLATIGAAFMTARLSDGVDVGQ